MPRQPPHKDEPRDFCPVCKSTFHTDTFELKTDSYADEDYASGDMKSIPVYTDFVFCKDCGVLRAYEHSIFDKVQKTKYCES